MNMDPQPFLLTKFEVNLGEGVPLAGAEPLLEQVLVEGVPQGPHGGVLLAPLTRLGVQVVWVQPARPNRTHTKCNDDLKYHNVTGTYL